MRHLACIDVPALPLQLLLRREPAWAREPVAVVDRDEPQGTILWVNERAHRNRVYPGRRYAEGLALASGLRAGVVDDEEIAAAVRRLVELVRASTPDVEPGRDEPGVFWADAGGLERSWPSLQAWADALVMRLRGDGFLATAVVGFDRFSTYALARSTRGVRVMRSPEAERRCADGVRLDRLRVEPKVRDALERLGVVDVRGLRALPPGGLLARFGPDAHRLHDAALGRTAVHLAPATPVASIVERFEVEPDDPELDLGGLVFLIEQAFGRMRAELARRGEALAALRLRLVFEKLPPCDQRVRPAEPTLDDVQVVDLVRLRIEGLDLPAAPTGFELEAEAVPATRAQLELFAETPRRELSAANRALARLSAELGDGAVVRAALRDGHLPEGQVQWEQLERLGVAHPDPARPLRLVRRVLARPVLLGDQRPGPDGWLAGGLAAGPVRVLCGPYTVSGGWWAGERHRDYHFAITENGTALWVFHDRRRRRWYLHGLVE